MSEVLCPRCGYRLVDDGSLSAQLVACPNCHQQFVMPTTPMPQFVQPAYAKPQGESSRHEPHQPPKNPGLAAVLSFFYVGLGQIYNGEIGKGLVMMFLPAPCAIVLLILYVSTGATVQESVASIPERPAISINSQRHFLDELAAEDWQRLPPRIRQAAESQLRQYEREVQTSADRVVGQATAWASGFVVVAGLLAAALFAVWVFGIFDAYKVAESTNRRRSARRR